MENQKQQNQEQKENKGGCGCKSSSETSSATVAPVEKTESAPAANTHASVEKKSEETLAPLSNVAAPIAPVVQETAVATPASPENQTSLSAPLSEVKAETVTQTTTSSAPVEAPSVPAAASNQ
jgi:hypothetical protein